MNTNTFVELGTIAKLMMGAGITGFIVGCLVGAWAVIKNEELLNKRK